MVWGLLDIPSTCLPSVPLLWPLGLFIYLTHACEATFHVAVLCAFVEDWDILLLFKVWDVTCS